MQDADFADLTPSDPNELLFSILVPAFNAERTIGQTISSILAQSCACWECVVVDDGSTDRTAVVAADFACADRRIRVFNQQNMGTALALNHAASQSRGRYFVALGADDLLVPCGLEAHARFILGCPGYDIYSSGAELMMPDGSRCPWEAGPSAGQSLTLGDFIERNRVLSTASISAELFRNLGGYRDTYLEDYDLWLRALALGARHIHDPSLVTSYRVTPSSKNANLDARARGAAEALARLSMDSRLDGSLRRRALRQARYCRATPLRRSLEDRLRHGDYSHIRRDYLDAGPAYRNRLNYVLGLGVLLLSPRVFGRLLGPEQQASNV